MTVLSKGDLVDALHGKGGGYRLNKPAEDYTVGSILKLTEGSLNVASCTAQGAAACARSTCCNTLPMWERLDKLIDDFFEGITLADLLKESQTQRV
jgi:Rrf2 family protein